MKKIIERIKAGDTALYKTDAEAYLIERVDEFFFVSYCWHDYTGWESDWIDKIPLSNEERIARLIMSIAMPEEWTLTKPVPCMTGEQ